MTLRKVDTYSSRSPHEVTTTRADTHTHTGATHTACVLSVEICWKRADFLSLINHPDSLKYISSLMTVFE